MKSSVTYRGKGEDCEGGRGVLKLKGKERSPLKRGAENFFLAWNKSLGKGKGDRRQMKQREYVLFFNEGEVSQIKV